MKVGWFTVMLYVINVAVRLLVSATSVLNVTTMIFVLPASQLVYTRNIS